MSKKTFPRQRVADQISDLRQMRGPIADIIGAACGLISQAQVAEVPDVLRIELLAALSHAEKADKFAQCRMRELYDTPTPSIANDDREPARSC